MTHSNLFQSQAEPIFITAESHPLLAPLVDRLNKALAREQMIGRAGELKWNRNAPTCLSTPLQRGKSILWFMGTIVGLSSSAKHGYGIKIEWLLQRDADRANSIVANMARPREELKDEKSMWINYREYGVCIS